MMRQLFCYGTLMAGELMQAVTGCRPTAEAARLHGYRRLAVRGASYPGIIEAAGCSVPGLLYRDIEARAWRALDRYEGEYYRRETVTVNLADGSCCTAQVYVIRLRYRALLSDREWHFDRAAQDYAHRQAKR